MRLVSRDDLTPPTCLLPCCCRRSRSRHQPAQVSALRLGPRWMDLWTNERATHAFELIIRRLTGARACASKAPHWRPISGERKQHLRLLGRHSEPTPWKTLRTRAPPSESWRIFRRKRNHNATHSFRSPSPSPLKWRRAQTSERPSLERQCQLEAARSTLSNAGGLYQPTECER